MQFGMQAVTLLISEGCAKIESSVVRHPAITLGVQASAPISIPVNATDLDVLAASENVQREDLSAAGLEKRLERAIEAREVAIEDAFKALEPFAVQKSEISELVDKHIHKIAKDVKKALGKSRSIHVVRPPKQ
jgi:predicted XRE-type DNA-binding protein